MSPVNGSSNIGEPTLCHHAKKSDKDPYDGSDDTSFLPEASDEYRNEPSGPCGMTVARLSITTVRAPHVVVVSRVNETIVRLMMEYAKHRRNIMTRLVRVGE